MKRKSRWSSTLVRERISVHALAAVRTMRVKIIGEAPEAREAAVAAAKRGFAKTQSFLGVLPRFDDGLPSLGAVTDDVTYLSGERAKLRDEEVPSAARPDPLLAQDPRALHKSRERRDCATDTAQDDPSHSTTLRVKALKRGRVQQLWQRQTPLFAFCVAVILCVLSVLAVNLLAS